MIPIGHFSGGDASIPMFLVGHFSSRNRTFLFPRVQLAPLFGTQWVSLESVLSTEPERSTSGEGRSDKADRCSADSSIKTESMSGSSAKRASAKRASPLLLGPPRPHKKQCYDISEQVCFRAQQTSPTDLLPLAFINIGLLRKKGAWNVEVADQRI